MNVSNLFHLVLAYLCSRDDNSWLDFEKQSIGMFSQLPSIDVILYT